MTVQSFCILSLCAICYQVMCVGPTGTGKTLTISDKLTRYMPKEYIPDFIVFSAKTSANQTQDLIDGKLDKRYIANGSSNAQCTCKVILSRKFLCKGRGNVVCCQLGYISWQFVVRWICFEGYSDYVVGRHMAIVLFSKL